MPRSSQPRSGHGRELVCLLPGMGAGWYACYWDGFSFPDFAAAIAFVVRIACPTHKRDHHPEVQLARRRAHVIWWTHDAGGVTQLDLDAAEATYAIGR